MEELEYQTNLVTPDQGSFLLPRTPQTSPSHEDIALRRHIGRLKDGDYSAVCRLRTGDELEPVAEALNELARELERKQSEKLRAA